MYIGPWQELKLARLISNPQFLENRFARGRSGAGSAQSDASESRNVERLKDYASSLDHQSVVERRLLPKPPRQRIPRALRIPKTLNEREFRVQKLRALYGLDRSSEAGASDETSDTRASHTSASPVVSQVSRSSCVPSHTPSPTDVTSTVASLTSRSTFVSQIARNSCRQFPVQQVISREENMPVLATRAIDLSIERPQCASSVRSVLVNCGESVVRAVEDRRIGGGGIVRGDGGRFVHAGEVSTRFSTSDSVRIKQSQLMQPSYRHIEESKNSSAAVLPSLAPSINKASAEAIRAGLFVQPVALPAIAIPGSKDPGPKNFDIEEERTRASDQVFEEVVDPMEMSMDDDALIAWSSALAVEDLD